MTSVVEICNMALGNIRAGSINNINEPSVQAQQCKLRYEILRNKCLRETNWGFSRRISPLALTTEEIFNHAYAYSYPADCLKIERLIPRSEQITVNGGSGASTYLSRNGDTRMLMNQPYTIEYQIYNLSNGKFIGTNESELRIDYTAKITDPNLFTEEFVMALSHLLASEIAVPIVGVDQGRKLRSDSLSLYQEYMRSAVASDNNEKYHSDVESEYITIRN